MNSGSIPTTPKKNSFTEIGQVMSPIKTSNPQLLSMKIEGPGGSTTYYLHAKPSGQGKTYSFHAALAVPQRGEPYGVGVKLAKLSPSDDKLSVYNSEKPGSQELAVALREVSKHGVAMGVTQTRFAVITPLLPIDAAKIVLALRTSKIIAPHTAEMIKAGLVRRFAVDIAQQLADLHAQGYSNNDIKLDNIRGTFNSEEKKTAFRIIDFNQQKTEAGQIVAQNFTAGFAPPYLFNSQRQLIDLNALLHDPAAAQWAAQHLLGKNDVWALGLTLLQLLSDRELPINYQTDPPTAADVEAARSAFLERPDLPFRSPLEGAAINPPTQLRADSPAAELSDIFLAAFRRQPSYATFIIQEMLRPLTEHRASAQQVANFFNNPENLHPPHPQPGDFTPEGFARFKENPDQLLSSLVSSYLTKSSRNGAAFLPPSLLSVAALHGSGIGMSNSQPMLSNA